MGKVLKNTAPGWAATYQQQLYLQENTELGGYPAQPHPPWKERERERPDDEGHLCQEARRTLS